MKEKVVVFTGAGVSAESGLPTFRDSDGLWRGYQPQQLATPEAWDTNPKLVLDFYNMRRQAIKRALPNAAHLAIAQLEQKFHVDVVTQNIDDLHERAGSSRVLHLHGEIMKGRSQCSPDVTIELDGCDIKVGDLAPDGHQLRPAVVWFGEPVTSMASAVNLVADADRLLVVGTSLTVWPAAGLVNRAAKAQQRVIVSKWVDMDVDGMTFHQEDAATAVPQIVDGWLNESSCHPG